MRAQLRVPAPTALARSTPSGQARTRRVESGTPEPLRPATLVFQVRKKFISFEREIFEAKDDFRHVRRDLAVDDFKEQMAKERTL